MVIFLYVRHENSYDQQHEHTDRIFRIVQIEEQAGNQSFEGGTPYPLPQAIRDEISEVEIAGGIHANGRVVALLPDGTKQRLKDSYFADAEMLEIFNFGLTAGVDPKLLDQPNQVLLAESIAKRWFGDADPIGQTLTLDNKIDVTVAGTFADTRQTHLAAEMLISLPSLTTEYLGFDPASWGVNVGGATYVKLADGQQNIEQLNSSLTAILAKNIDQDGGVKTSLVAQALSDIHFQTQFDDAMSVQPINPSYLWVAASIGLLILLMACFNFVNLSLAQSLAKSQEVGMRKILGAKGGQLWFQYWGEALVMALMAGVFSVGVLVWALPHLEEMLKQEIVFSGWADGSLIGFGLAILLFISFVAGGYPAWVIARKQPKEVLKGSKVVSSRAEQGLRKSMVLAQFVITILMICSAITVTRQLDFMKNKDLGFRRDAILQVSQSNPGMDPTLRQEWLRHPGVEEVTFSLGAPTSNNNLGSEYYPKGDTNNAHDMGIKPVDEHYADVYELEVVEGRFLNSADMQKIAEGFPEEGQEWPMVINETMAATLGYDPSESVIGKRVLLGINDAQGSIVGVMKDFNTSSLHEKLDPVVMMPFSPLCYQIGVKFDASQITSVLAHLEEVWNQQRPDALFDYTFLDESIADQYLNEGRTNTLLKIFAGLAIFIACLGLFGLTAIMVRQRRREIGLRKVLGASVSNLWGLLSKDMIRLIGISAIIATPLAWWGMQQWLANFAYRITISPWTFVFAAMLLLVIALLTVSGQAFKAALANPVEALKNE
jgi:ABC-type antimicrobial peptide transport system permease subunit